MSIKGSFNLLTKKLYNNRANIAFYAGTALTIVGTGLFIHATRKNEEVITEHKLAMAVTDKDDKKTKRKICKNTVIRTAKNYAAPVAVSGTGYALQIYANTTHNKEIGALNTALTATTLAYEALKEKIIQEHGADEWERLSGVSTETIVDEETGEVTESTQFDKEGFPLYSVLFDEANKYFEKSTGANRRFLCGKLKQANYDLGSCRVIMLTDILKNYLGYSLVPGEYFSAEYLESISKAGWFIGDADEPTNYIDFFGKGSATERSMNDTENCVLLEFNCYHNVYEAIKRSKRSRKYTTLQQMREFNKDKNK